MFTLASILVGLGLAKHLASTDLYKGAAYVMAASGLVGLVNFLLGMKGPRLGLESLFTINGIALFAAGVCLLVVGIGMYKGRIEFAERE